MIFEGENLIQLFDLLSFHLIFSAPARNWFWHECCLEQNGVKEQYKNSYCGILCLWSRSLWIWRFCDGDISLGLFHLLDIKVVQKILNHIGTCLLIVSVGFIRIWCLYILIQDHTVVSAFVKFGNVKLEYKKLLLRILRKTFSRPFRKRLK